MPATAPTAPSDTERNRIEAWIIQALDEAAGPDPVPSRPELRLRSAPAPTSAALGTWATLHVRRVGAACVARLAVDALIKPQLLAEVRQELLALAASCSGRIVLDLSNVEKLASAFVATLIRVQRRCTTRDGGELRLCGLRPDLQPLLTLTGLDRILPIFPDEAAALAAPWVRPRQAASLPVEVLRELAVPNAPDVEAAPVQPLYLRIESGSRRGRVASVRHARATLGRAGDCELRCPCPSVSRHHARLCWTSDGWILADLGSTNGTRLNGHRLTEPSPVRPGDSIVLGSFRLTVVDPDAAVPPSSLDEQVAAWLLGPEAEGPTTEDQPPIADNDPETVAALPDGVRLLAPRIDETDDPESWRHRLDEAIGDVPDARLVIDLQYVSTLPNRALGIILARALELQRQGGGLRLAHPNPALRAHLDWLRVPELIGVYTRVEDAILTSWS
ncbi:MAG: hypothetical protein KatS3mg108_1452 [Isosphaeraceae bacterium]|jgi:anti-anti-sigma factor|nr:MAG: hypothetical protein KatS3mg108_1452 [Isosphaeraceae bacterium]